MGEGVRHTDTEPPCGEVLQQMAELGQSGRERGQVSQEFDVSMPRSST